jgi:hypothetical protein
MEGISAAMSFEGALNGAVFLTFVKQVLTPTLSAGDVLFWIISVPTR